VADLKGIPSPPAETTRTVLATHDSAPLAECLQVILKVSQNLHAEMLLRTLGRERRNVGSVEAGVAEVNGFLAEIGIPATEVVLRDGSGLSRLNLVTPQATVALLRTMHESEHGAAWMALPPVAGGDGSLNGRMKAVPTRGRVWAKTGSLTGVAALAGYVADENDRLLAFAIFVNNHNMSSGAAALLIDRLVAEIASNR
jgi:D-alanyl-D-alanine carboxypeptidase/D-alanyl-D-alanine-endopeptidase (penicillin-binding protein 4)